MSKWKNQIDLLLTGLSRDYVAFRRSIDDDIWQCEKNARNIERGGLNETPEQRQREFLSELGERLRHELKTGSDNPAWKLAQDFLTGKIARVPEHQRPK